MICYERVPHLAGGIDLERQNSLIPPSQTLSVLSDNALALARMHRQGLIHGDVKPANIAVTKTASGAYHGTLLDIGSMHQPEMVSGHLDTTIDGVMIRFMTLDVKTLRGVVHFPIPTTPDYYNGFFAQALKEKDPALLTMTDVRAFGLTIASLLHDRGFISTNRPTSDIDVFTLAKQRRTFKERNQKFPPPELQELYDLTLQLIFVDLHPEVANLDIAAEKLQSLVARFEKTIDPYMVSPNTQQNQSTLLAG